MEIADFPNWKMVFFHSYVNVYQSVNHDIVHIVPLNPIKSELNHNKSPWNPPYKLSHQSHQLSIQLLFLG